MTSIGPGFGLRLPDPAFLLSLYNQQIREGLVSLHPWQIEVLQKYADPSFDYTQGINRINLVANNGSGKSAMIVAPCAVWTSLTFPNARTVITSASGQQLDRQTGRAVRHLCEQVNQTHKQDLWDIKYREYTFTPDPVNRPDVKSTIEMYATDEPGKAEGYHPHVPGGMFSMIADEAKSISDDLFQPIERCNGKTHWLNVSSPGAPLGFFYNAVTSARWWTKKVTAYDCPHIKQDEIDGAREAYGEHSAFFRSAYLAEFTSVNETVVIPYERILRQYREPWTFLDDSRIRAGVDLSGGGDENVVSVWRGNKQLGLEAFRYSDTRQTITHLVNVFRKYELRGENIFIDDGYIGRAVIHSMRDHNYDCVAVRFGASALNSTAYANRGTELWFNFERHLPYLIFAQDPTQMKQLASRYYKQSDRNSKIILESKREAKANGHSSPDRADATVLAFSDLPLGYFGGNAFIAQESTPEDEARELFNRLIREKGNLTLTPEQLDLVTERYRTILAARKPHPSDSDDMRYDVSRMGGGRRSRMTLNEMLSGDR